jgi:hypothetical protein
VYNVVTALAVLVAALLTVLDLSRRIEDAER